MRLHRTLTPIVFTLFLFSWPTRLHADYQAGLDAYYQGDYVTALKEWRSLAEQGDAQSIRTRERLGGLLKYYYHKAA